MNEKEVAKYTGTSKVAKAFGYAGMVVYMYFGIIKQNPVSELFLVLITILIVGVDVAIKIMEARK